MVVAKHSIFRLTPRKESLKTRLDVMLWYPTCGCDLWVASSTLQSKQTATAFSIFYIYSLWLPPTVIREFFSGSQGKNLFANA